MTSTAAPAPSKARAQPRRPSPRRSWDALGARTHLGEHRRGWARVQGPGAVDVRHHLEVVPVATGVVEEWRAVAPLERVEGPGAGVGLAELGDCGQLREGWGDGPLRDPSVLSSRCFRRSTPRPGRVGRPGVRAGSAHELDNARDHHIRAMRSVPALVCVEVPGRRDRSAALAHSERVGRGGAPRATPPRPCPCPPLGPGQRIVVGFEVGVVADPYARGPKLVFSCSGHARWQTGPNY
jgi:hypothetical protein